MSRLFNSFTSLKHQLFLFGQFLQCTVNKGFLGFLCQEYVLKAYLYLGANPPFWGGFGVTSEKGANIFYQWDAGFPHHMVQHLLREEWVSAPMDDGWFSALGLFWLALEYIWMLQISSFLLITGFCN